MKTILLPLFILLFSSTLYAQIQWLETGQQWRFCSWMGWVGEIGCDTLKVVTDTVIAGNVCKKMTFLSGYEKYAYEISDKVFVSDDGSSFQKVYDFDMIEGEVLDVGFFTYQVDSLMEVDLGDFSNVRVQKAHIVGDSYRGISNFYIVEGIGIVKSFQPEWDGQCVCGHFFPSLLTCDFNVDGMDTYLSWFQQDGNLFLPDENFGCSGIIINVQTPASLSNVRIEPNPVAATCRLIHSFPSSEGILTLFNYAGTAVRQWEPLPENLDLTTFPSGLYVLTIRRDGQVIWSGKIVKQ
jgi:hypothetical protein